MRATVALVGTTAVALVVAVTVGGGGGPTGGPPTDQPGPVALPDDLVLASSLTAFDGCDDYLTHVREHALEQVGPYGLDAHDGWWGGREFAADDGQSLADATEAGGAPAADGGAADVFSGTNVQEEGVDEPDRVKTDGRFLYVVHHDTVRIVDLQGDDPEVVASIPLGDTWGAQLLLDGDRLLVSTPATDHHLRTPAGDTADVMPGPGWGWSGTTLTVHDVSDPTRPRERETLTLDGQVLSSRLVDGTVRVVVRAEPTGLAFEAPAGGGLRAERAATEANREVIRRSTADQWIPYYVHETSGGRVTEGSLVPCERIARPASFSGLSTVTVLTVDLQGVLRPEDGATAVLGGGETVYASTDRLYVATTRWQDVVPAGRSPEVGDDVLIQPAPVEATTTELHAFDLNDPRRAPHVASGAVRGRLLSQWALSEHEGILRVASTTGDPWSGAEPSQSRVTTLAERGGQLVELGLVDGLGVTETIHAVRFIGDLGYVVTFRQTDPLYTIDLSDPADPREVGELKIPGFSSYLHPIGDGLLLGIGQDADEEGVATGGQVSLFDISDHADPRRIDTLDLGEGWSPVQEDHRAFLHWAPTGLSVVPFESWSASAEEAADTSGAAAFTADRADGLTLERRLSHVPQVLAETAPAGIDETRLWDVQWQSVVQRSVVVGDQLLTISEAGLATHDLATLEDLGWMPWR